MDKGKNELRMNRNDNKNVYQMMAIKVILMTMTAIHQWGRLF